MEKHEHEDEMDCIISEIEADYIDEDETSDAEAPAEAPQAEGHEDEAEEATEPDGESLQACLIKQIHDDPELRYLYADNPRRTLSRIFMQATEVLPGRAIASDADLAEAHARGIDLMRNMDFNVLYGHGDWDAVFDQVWKFLLPRRMTRFGDHAANKHHVHSHVLRYHIERDIPADRFEMKTKKQRVTIDEVVFILRRITVKVFDALNRKKRDRARLAHNYFLNEGFKKAYRQATGRTLGKSKHKIIFITDLLHDFNLVRKIRKRAKENKNAVNEYQLGKSNPYYDEIDI